MRYSQPRAISRLTAAAAISALPWVSLRMPTITHATVADSVGGCNCIMSRPRRTPQDGHSYQHMMADKPDALNHGGLAADGGEERARLHATDGAPHAAAGRTVPPNHPIDHRCR